MAVENLDQLVELIITRSPAEGVGLRTFVKGEISDFFAHSVARYCKRTNSLLTYDLLADFIRLTLQSDSKTETNKGEKK